MGSLRHPELEAELARGLLRPVYYFAGDEDVLKSDAVAGVVEQALDVAERQFNYDDRQVAELDVERLATLLYTPPLLAERRVVVLRGIEALRRKPKLRQWLNGATASLPPELVLVLVSSGADKHDEQLTSNATVVTFEPTPDEAVHWIERRAKSLGLSLEQAGITALHDACAGSLAAVDGEIAKLAAAFGDEVVSAADVVRFAGIRSGETLPDLVELIMTRRSGDALRLVDSVLEQPGVTGVRVVMALGTGLLGTRLAVAAADRGATGRRLSDAVFQAIRRTRPAGLGPWREVTGRWTRWAGHWSDPELAAAITRALEADRALKSSGVAGEAAVLRHLILAVSARDMAA